MVSPGVVPLLPPPLVTPLIDCLETLVPEMMYYIRVDRVGRYNSYCTRSVISRHSVIQPNDISGHHESSVIVDHTRLPDSGQYSQ